MSKTSKTIMRKFNRRLNRFEDLVQSHFGNEEKIHTILARVYLTDFVEETIEELIQKGGLL